MRLSRFTTLTITQIRSETPETVIIFAKERNQFQSYIYDRVFDWGSWGIHRLEDAWDILREPEKTCAGPITHLAFLKGWEEVEGACEIFVNVVLPMMQKGALKVDTSRTDDTDDS